MLYKIQKGTVEYGADVILDNIDFEIKNKNEKNISACNCNHDDTRCLC